MSDSQQLHSWEELAAQGDTLAMTQLGVYSNRIGDLDAAHEWFFRAAEAGDARAAAYLGWVFKRYGGIEDAIHWTRVAIGRGDGAAHSQLESLLHPETRNQFYPSVMTVMHQNRREAFAAVEAGDEDRAFQLLTIGEEWGDADAIVMLGEWWERQGTLGHAILYYQLAISANPLQSSGAQSKLRSILTRIAQQKEDRDTTASVCRVSPAAEAQEHACKLMPYLVGLAGNIVDRGDLDSYPHLNQLCQSVMADATRSRAMFWALLTASAACRDQTKFEAWRSRGSGIFFQVVLRLFILIKAVSSGAPNGKALAETIDELIEEAGRTSEPWTTLSQLTVAVLEASNRGQLEIWMHSSAS